MAESARVTSVDAVRGFIPAVVEFRQSVQASLLSAEASAGRALDWVQKDRLPHWKREVRRRQELVVRARSTLASKRPIDSDMPRSTAEAEIALHKAQRALKEAEAKVVQTQRWAGALAKTVEEFRAAVSPLGWFASSELPKAIAALEAMGNALEAYLATGGDAGAANAPTLEGVEGQAPAGGAEAPSAPASTSPRGAQEPPP